MGLRLSRAVVDNFSIREVVASDAEFSQCGLCTSMSARRRSLRLRQLAARGVRWAEYRRRGLEPTAAPRLRA